MADYQTTRKLSNDPTTPHPQCLVHANQVAHQVLIKGQGTMSTKPKRLILPHIQEGTAAMAQPFSEEEYKKGIAALTNNKAADRDDVLVEQLKHLGQKANKWFHTMLNVCFTENMSPIYGDNPRLSPYLRQGKTPRFLRTTYLSPCYAIRTNFTYE